MKLFTNKNSHLPKQVFLNSKRSIGRCLAQELQIKLAETASAIAHFPGEFLLFYLVAIRREGLSQIGNLDGSWHMPCAFDLCVI